MAKKATTIPLAGFDPEGEPEIRLMPDGMLYLVFEFMPPSWAEDDSGEFEDFDQELTRAAGQPVLWEDREIFIITEPTPDAVDRLRTFLAAYRSSPRPLQASKKFTQQSCRNALITNLLEILPAGFRHQKSAYGLVRKFKGGFHLFYVSVSSHGPYHCDLPAAIRFDAIEKLMRVVCPSLGTTSPTFHSGGLEYFIDVKSVAPKTDRDELFLASPEDVAETVRALAPTFRDKIMPFLDAHADLASVAELVRAEVEWNKGYQTRYRELIVAHLTGKPDFESTYRKRHPEISEHHQAEHFVEGYHKLAAHLRSLRNA